VGEREVGVLEAPASDEEKGKISRRVEWKRATREKGWAALLDLLLPPK